MSEQTTSQEKYSWWQVQKSIWHFLGENKSRYIIYNLLVIIVLFYDLIPPFILGKVVDFFTTYRRGDSLTTFYWYTIFLGATFILISLVRLGSKNKLGKISITAKATARVQGFERLMDFSLQWHSQENTGNKVQRIFAGSQAIHEWAFQATNSVYPMATAFAGVLLAFLFLNPAYLIFTLIYVALFFTIEYIFNRELTKISNELNLYREKSSGTYIEGTGNILAVKALGAEKNIHGQVKNAEEIARKLEIVQSTVATRKWYFFQTLNGLSLACFLLMMGRSLISGAITVGSIIIFFSYFERLRGAAGQATDISSKVVQLKSNIVRMMPIFLQNPPVATGDEQFPRNWKDITIHNGSFKYPSGQMGLENLNFVMQRGEKLGVAGLSGSGKSTLIKILLGLYELESGEFKIGRHDYYSISHDEIIKNIAVVLQETELFNLSLRDNITVTRDVNARILETAIKVSHLSDVIAKLPEGLNTLIGERGYTLSGGERQRLGIARAICKDAPILIFDEATSSLDSKTEQSIMEELINSLGEKTMLIIAHRLSTLKDTNRLLVFDKGRIVEEGQFDKLKHREGSRFGELYHLQQK